jgi:CheY-like chemotaxis protein
VIRLVSIKFTITDQGIGIPKNKLHLLFTPFTQLDSGLKKAYSGAGIGLSICKNLIDLMNGNFEVTSEESIGTTFSFTIRLPEYTPVNSINAINYKALIGKSVLIIDDNETNLKYIENTLLQSKMFVMKSTSAKHAIDDYLINKIPFAMIIVDICMADIDGCELANIARNNYGYKCPIFGMSSINTDLIPDKHNFTKIMMKPINSLELISTLSKAEDPASPVTPSWSRSSSIAAPITYDTAILLVEDNQVNIDVTVSQLEIIGYKNVTVAKTGTEAVALAKKNKYNIIFMDISLSADMDGIEATERILAYYKQIGHKMAIIGLTANTMHETIALAKSVGMKKVLLKPVSIDTLMGAVPAPITPQPQLALRA